MRLLTFPLVCLFLTAVIAQEPTNETEPVFEFIATLFTSCGNNKVSCTAILYTNTTVFTAAQCAKLDQSLGCEIEYHICYNPGKCVATINDEHCRKVEYLPKEDKKEQTDFMIIEEICIIELSPDKAFTVPENATMPIIDTKMTTKDIRTAHGVVIWCDAGIMYVDKQHIVDQPQMSSPRASSPNSTFFTKWDSETDTFTSGVLNQSTSALILYDHENRICLTGLGVQAFTELQEYKFVPFFFETVEDEEELEKYGYEVDNSISEHHLSKRSKRSNNFFKRMGKEIRYYFRRMEVRDIFNSIGETFSSLVS